MKKHTNQFRMPVYRALGLFGLILALVVLSSHNLYIKLNSYILKVNQEATLSLYNGTFENSENIISRDRILDASLLINGNRMAIDSSQWADKDSTLTQFKFTPLEEGTYLVGVSTKPRTIALKAKDFNNYLEHDGVLDILDHRKTHGLLENDAVELYEKHVKTIYQVGETKSDDWKTILGYPIEFVPQSNPYEKNTGDKIDVKLLLNGKPLENHLVYVGKSKPTHSCNHEHHDHSHDHDAAHEHSHDDHDHSHDHDAAHEHSHDDHDHSHDHDAAHEHSHDDHDHSHDHDAAHEHSHDDHDHSHDHDAAHEHSHDDHNHSNDHNHNKGFNGSTQLRTDSEGLITIDLDEDGVYYLRTIYMRTTNIPEEFKATHHSKWATLTFEVTHNHSESDHNHDHSHDHEGGSSIWFFVLGSILLIVILFLIFSRKSK